MFSRDIFYFTLFSNLKLIKNMKELLFNYFSLLLNKNYMDYRSREGLEMRHVPSIFTHILLFEWIKLLLSGGNYFYTDVLLPIGVSIDTNKRKSIF